MEIRHNFNYSKITLKNSSDNNNDTRRCIQLKSHLKSSLKLYWIVGKTRNNAIIQRGIDYDEEDDKWSREINSGCVYSKLNDRSKPEKLMNE